MIGRKVASLDNLVELQQRLEGGQNAGFKLEKLNDNLIDNGFKESRGNETFAASLGQRISIGADRLDFEPTLSLPGPLSSSSSSNMDPSNFSSVATRAPTADRSIWGLRPQPATNLAVPQHPTRPRSISQDYNHPPPRFSESFWLRDDGGIQQQQQQHSQNEIHRLIRDPLAHQRRSSNTTLIESSQLDVGSSSFMDILPTSNFSWPVDDDTRPPQQRPPPTMTLLSSFSSGGGGLKKSASMASLPFERTSFENQPHATTSSVYSSSSSFHPSMPHRQDLQYVKTGIHPPPPPLNENMNPNIRSQPPPLCRYYVQGYCSRGSRCFFSHNTNHSSSVPLLSSASSSNHAPSFPLPPQLPSTANNYGNHPVQQSGPPSHISNLTVSGSSALLPSVSPLLKSMDALQLSSTHQQPSPQPIQSHPKQLPQNRDQRNGEANVGGSGQRNTHSQFPPPSLPLDSLQYAGIKLHGPKPSKKHSEEEANRFANVRIEDLVGQYYYLCKDQFGCRYLQKQIEEAPQLTIGYIFQDIFDHLTELMTDPFGNYLCQKLLEKCNDSQRAQIVARVAPHLVTVSLNMHGTRAVQKLIEYVIEPEQIQVIVDSLSTGAVRLIKDLNGNHVIQKCLSKLEPHLNQFVFDAVTANCIQVATHRHGCCVLQRCIDHAVESQKLQLVQEIAANGLQLVQDPFGNYVVQYVLDLADKKYSECAVRPFIGNVCSLSVQKFSSNVIEKCIRVSGTEMRHQLIEELLDQTRLEVLLKDSYANYVVQTALDYADANQRQRLINCIRPILPLIRGTPYGKRIISKLSL